jgi:hypothetical protein
MTRAAAELPADMGTVAALRIVAVGGAPAGAPLALPAAAVSDLTQAVDALYTTALALEFAKGEARADAAAIVSAAAALCQATTAAVRGAEPSIGAASLISSAAADILVLDSSITLTSVALLLSKLAHSDADAHIAPAHRAIAALYTAAGTVLDAGSVVLVTSRELHGVMAR